MLYVSTRLYLALLFFVATVLLSDSQRASQQAPAAKPKTYFLASYGNDKHEGGRDQPWKTIRRLNRSRLNAGDSVVFKGGEVFTGSIVVDSYESGTMQAPITFTSSGADNALIEAGKKFAFSVQGAGYIIVRQLSFTGAGRKDGNTADGVAVMNSHHVLLDQLDIKGFQKAGLLVYASSYVDVRNVYAHDNGFAGISVLGAQVKTSCKDITISLCKAENNPGDPTNLQNHSGNGIIAGFCKRVIIDRCVATNNGWDMPRKGNGPVGIWCFEADSVLIQQCISYRNKTAPGAGDGGGYDLDGGVTNSVIQYCLSYENEGSAFGIFQYAGASNWYNNTVRFNISQNDGNVSPAHAGVFVWNSSRDASQLKDLYFYNNTIYNEGGAAIRYEAESEHAGFRFYNNIFVAKDTLITGVESTGIFLGNDWWSRSGDFIVDGMNTFEEWAQLKGKEQWKNKYIGLNADPQFNDSGRHIMTDPLQLRSFNRFKLPPGSPLRKHGLDLRRLFGIDIGNRDFNGGPLLPTGMGASF